MYCPDCNRPLAGDPDVCPGCGHQFKSEESESTDDGKNQTVPSPSSAGETSYSGDTGQSGHGPKLERKVLISAIALGIPIVSFFIYVIIFRITDAVPSIGLSIVIGLLILASLFLVPLSLLLGILGLRTIKKSVVNMAGKSLAFLTISLSSLLIVGGVVSAVIAVSNFDLANIMDAMSGNNPEGVIILIEIGIETSEEQNRNDGLQNSFGTFFPSTLDQAEPLSNSGPDNPFFTTALPFTNGWSFPGWQKGSEINTYILLSDSSQYVYDPLDGTFQKK